MRRPRYLRLRFAIWRGRAWWQLLDLYSRLLFRAGMFFLLRSNHLRQENHLEPILPRQLTRYPRTSSARYPRSIR